MTTLKLPTGLESLTLEQINSFGHENWMLLGESDKSFLKTRWMELTYQSIQQKVDEGYKHIQLAHGCIKVKKTKTGTIFSMRNGIGTGKDTTTSQDLKFVANNAFKCGWGQVQRCS